MYYNDSFNSVKIKNRGFLYFIKKIFHILPFKAQIKTQNADYNVEINISQIRMKKIVDRICRNIVESIK